MLNLLDSKLIGDAIALPLATESLISSSKTVTEHLKTRGDEITKSITDNEGKIDQGKLIGQTLATQELSLVRGIVLNKITP